MSGCCDSKVEAKPPEIQRAMDGLGEGTDRLAASLEELRQRLRSVLQDPPSERPEPPDTGCDTVHLWGCIDAQAERVNVMNGEVCRLMYDLQL